MKVDPAALINRACVSSPILKGDFCIFSGLYSKLLHLPQILVCRRMLGSNPGLCINASLKNFIPTLMGVCLVRVSEMENISRGPTFGNFVSILSVGTMQNNNRSTDSPLPPLLNVIFCVRVSLRTVKILLTQH